MLFTDVFFFDIQSAGTGTCFVSPDGHCTSGSARFVVSSPLHGRVLVIPTYVSEETPHNMNGMIALRLGG